MAWLLAVAAFLAVGGGIGVWLLMNHQTSSARLLKGYSQAPEIAWEYSKNSSSTVGASPDGVLIVPNPKSHEKDLVLLNWADGNVRWSVDISDEIAGVEYVNPVTREGLIGYVGVWVGTQGGKTQVLLYRASSGEFVTRIDLELGWFLIADSGAVYHLVPVTPETTQVRRYRSMGEFGQSQWSQVVPTQYGESIGVLEREGYADFCWQGELAYYSCFASMSIKDGSPPVWWADEAYFSRAGNIVVVSSADSFVTAYNGAGDKIWEREPRAGSLWASDDVLLQRDHDSTTVRRIELSTGEVAWEADWERGWVATGLAGGKLTAVNRADGYEVGSVDLGSGKTDFHRYSVNGEVVSYLTESGEIVAAVRDNNELLLIGISPGKSEVMWRTSFDNYFGAFQAMGGLWLLGENKIAVVK